MRLPFAKLINKAELQSIPYEGSGAVFRIAFLQVGVRMLPFCQQRKMASTPADHVDRLADIIFPSDRVLDFINAWHFRRHR